jgi:hypothetical protein
VTYAATKTLLETIVSRLATQESDARERDRVDLAEECLAELQALVLECRSSRAGGRHDDEDRGRRGKSAKESDSENLNRVIADISTMLLAMRKGDRQGALDSGNRALAAL